MDQFFAALMGAIVGGLLAILGAFKLDTHQRNKRRENLRAAVAVEVASLVELVQRQEYAAHLCAFADYVLTLPLGQSRILKIPIQQSYFTIYEMNASSIGELPTSEAVEIIGFYQQARSIVDSVTNDTQPNPWVSNEDVASYYRSVANSVDNLCRFGRELVATLTTSSVTELINSTAERLAGAAEAGAIVEKLPRA